MVLGKREKQLLVGAVIAVGTAVLYLAVTPLCDAIAETTRLKDQKTAEVNDARSVITRREKLTPLWREMCDSGLKGDRAEAESQMLRSLSDWAKAEHIDLSKQVDRQSAKGRLPEIMFVAKTNTSITMKALAGMLQRIKNSKIPIKIIDLSIKATKESTDALTVSMTLSTVYTAAEVQPPTLAKTTTETTGGRR